MVLTKAILLLSLKLPIGNFANPGKNVANNTDATNGSATGKIPLALNLPIVLLEIRMIPLHLKMLLIIMLLMVKILLQLWQLMIKEKILLQLKIPIYNYANSDATNGFTTSKDSGSSESTNNATRLQEDMDVLYIHASDGANTVGENVANIDVTNVMVLPQVKIFYPIL